MAIVKTATEVQAIDIPGMQSMTPQEYRSHLKQFGLFYFDHHDVLRSSVAGYPLATSKEQLEILVEVLESLKDRFE